MKKWHLALTLFSCILGAIAFPAFGKEGSSQSQAGTAESAAVAKGAQWQKFTSLMGRFEVGLPSDPDYYEQDIVMPGMDLKVIVGIYVSIANNSEAYLAAFSVYPEEVDVSSPERNLEGALNGQVQSDVNSKLVSAEYTKFQDHPAVDFVIKLSHDIYRRGRLIMVGSVLYQLVYVYQGDSYHAGEYQDFITSFHLLSE